MELIFCYTSCGSPYLLINSSLAKKRLPLLFQDLESFDFQEIEILKTMNHYAIVRYLDSFTDGALFIIMELCDYGNLEELILKKVVHSSV